MVRIPTRNNYFGINMEWTMMKVRENCERPLVGPMSGHNSISARGNSAIAKPEVDPLVAMRIRTSNGMNFFDPCLLKELSGGSFTDQDKNVVIRELEGSASRTGSRRIDRYMVKKGWRDRK